MGAFIPRRPPRKHEVVGHVRRIRGEARPQAARLAAEHGVKLLPGETWVVPHERGGEGRGETPRIVARSATLQLEDILAQHLEESQEVRV